MNQVKFLSPDIVKAQEGLSELTEEQVGQIVTLANNKFKKEIDTASGTWHKRLEEDIKELYGMEKPESLMKSHEFLKLAKSKHDEKVQQQIEEAKQAGGGKKSEAVEAYEKKLADQTKLIEELKGKVSTERKSLEEQLQQAKKENIVLQAGFEKASALSGLQFDELTPEPVRNDFLESKWNTVLSQFTPEMENGKIQWRDKEGNLVYNEQKGHELMTTADLYLKEIKPVIKQGRKQPGAGTKPGGAPAGGANLDIGGAKTQVEADERITEHLLAKGLQRGTTAFKDEHMKIREENKVTSLPIQ